MQLVLIVIYLAVAWHFLNFFQQKMGIFYFGKVSDYFIYKLIICLFLGWLLIPIGLIVAIVKKSSASKSNK